MTDQKLKTTRVVVRLDSKEKGHLTKVASESGLSLSEYIRVRMLEEERLDKPSAYKKDMTTFTVLGYYLLGKMAKKQLSEEEIKESNKRAALFLKEYNLQDE